MIAIYVLKLHKSPSSEASNKFNYVENLLCTIGDENLLHEFEFVLKKF